MHVWPSAFWGGVVLSRVCCQRVRQRVTFEVEPQSNKIPFTGPELRRCIGRCSYWVHDWDDVSNQWQCQNQCVYVMHSYHRWCVCGGIHR